MRGEDSYRPIGVFDSGVGGLTVARAIRDLLPNESIVYAADTAHAPYGPRPIAQVREFSLEMLDTLVEQGVKMLVIACNTASAAVLRDAHERYSIPVVEVIGPTVRRAMHTTRTGRVGLIGTAGTIQSRVYDDLFSMRPEIGLTAAACPRFVEYVEAGRTSGPEIMQAAREYLAPLIEAEVDTLVLGCTHYPFLRGALTQVMGPGVSLVSSDIETASEVYRMLTETQLLRPPSAGIPVIRYETTQPDNEWFVTLAGRLLGHGVSEAAITQAIPIRHPNQVEENHD